MRIANNLLGDRVPAVGICIRAAIPECMVRNALHEHSKIPLFLVEEGFAVRDQELQIAKLRPVNGGVVDLRNNAVPDREPEVARGGIRCANAGLVAMRPAGFDSWLTEGFYSSNSPHLRASSLLILKSATERRWSIVLYLVCGSCQKRWSVCDRVSSVDGIA